MPSSVLKLQMSNQSTQAVMLVLKTTGVSTGSSQLLETQVNNNTYSIYVSPGTISGKNKVLLYENSNPFSGVYEPAKLYINGKMAPINSAEISLNQWTSLIINFNNPAESSNNTQNYMKILGDVDTNIAIFSSYCLSTSTLKESVIYKYWDDIDNATWYSYSSNTWKDVFGTFTDLSASSGVNNIWDTFLNRNIITQNKDLLSLNDIIPLTMGNYKYETAVSGLTKVYISRSPA